MSLLEKRGVPVVGFTARTFEDDCHLSARVFGVPNISPVIVPECFTNQAKEDVWKMVDDAWPVVIDGLTKDKDTSGDAHFDRMRLESAPEIVIEGADLLDAFENMQALFVKNYWSDGLPLMAPTAKKVDAMIRASGRDGDEVVAKFAPGHGIGTVRKIAANAVMAGCKPECMPVIMAIVECMLEPSMGLRTWAMSTGPQFPLVLVSGPYADEIGMNHGICALGPASVSQVNVSIGRALRLIMMNVGLSYPAITDMDTIGTPGKFSACVAENEAKTPWATWRERWGFAKDDTVVSLNVPYGMSEFFDFENPTPEGIIESWSSLTRNATGSPRYGDWLIKTNAPLEAGYPFHGEFANVLLMAPDHAKIFGRAGWKPRDIALAIHEKTRLPFRELMSNKSWQNFRFAHPELSWLESQPETLVSVNPKPECFEFFVVGGSAGRSQYCFGGTNTVTKKVELP